MFKDPMVIAAIISAVISALIGVCGIILTQWFNYRQRKDDADERFFYEIYQRRLALYEEVIKTLASMNRPEEEFLKLSLDEFFNKVFADFHTLLVLANRLAMYGNSRTSSIIADASASLKKICEEAGKPSLPIQVLSVAANLSPVESLITSFMRLISKSLREFTVSVREETDPDFVNQKLDEIQKKIAGKKQKKK